MKTPSPDVSIVVAVRNDAAALDATLRSIERQRPAAGSVEVVVVDGASTDGTVAVAERSAVPDLVISEPDDGIYDAMNKGAARASGTWLHFLNAGDLFASDDALARVLRGLAQTDAAGRDWFVAGAAYVGGKVDGQVIANVPHRRWAHAHGLQPHCHQATWFRRTAFQALGGHSLEHSFVGDFDLILRFGLAGAPGQDRRVAISYLEGGLSAQRAAEVPRLLREVRRERLGLTGAARLGDDAIDLGVRVLTRGRRIGWWLRAAALYVPKRVGRRARASLAGQS
ncbi:glycosyltransferase [uncultured Amnibacterium sp.]|uniref:glycosyltransferase n=1 Tax=uncultured Amnibacterium sp. TaxID=1631851 RepID=UPI0035CC5D20